MDTIRKNLLQLVNYVLKNTHFSLVNVSKCCRLYWKITKKIKNQTLSEWYQKCILNIMFPNSVENW